MNGMHGIIFSYEKKSGLRELIENRVHGSVPFGGDYRIIDFILSSMVNAGITDVGVIMHGKCQSLLDHLGWVALSNWMAPSQQGHLYSSIPAIAFPPIVPKGAGGSSPAPLFLRQSPRQSGRLRNP